MVPLVQHPAGLEKEYLHMLLHREATRFPENRIDSARKTLKQNPAP